MSDPTLHLAWTVDDGPTSHTKDMIDVFQTVLPKKHIPATWYIQWDFLLKQPAFYDTYFSLQQSGHEIAIHGVSAVANHMLWFPTDKSDVAAFASIKEALEAIDAFKQHLKAKGLNAKFVRAPTGLISEISGYLKKLGVSKEQTRLELARQLIFQKPLSEADSKQPALQKVRADLETLRTRLPTMGLHMWGGAPTDTFSTQSWEAESAGRGTARTDNVTKITESLIAKIAADKARKERSLVILCHDTTAVDVDEVRGDIGRIEAQAKSKGVRIAYQTMSGLFTKVVGKAP